MVPTLVELCGLRTPPSGKPLDGASYAPLLFDAAATPRLPAHRFWQWNRKSPLYTHNAAVREGDWKLVRPYVTRNIPAGESDAAPRLYDLGKDPAERRDLAAERPDLRDRLLKQLEAWSREVEQDRLSSADPVR